MKFKKVRRRKVYITWVGHKHGYTAYVYLLPKTDIEGKMYFHYAVVRPNRSSYASLDSSLVYFDFETVCDAAERWIDEDIKKA
jgi:hypothetical protein